MLNTNEGSREGTTDGAWLGSKLDCSDCISNRYKDGSRLSIKERGVREGATDFTWLEFKLECRNSSISYSCNDRSMLSINEGSRESVRDGSWLESMDGCWSEPFIVGVWLGLVWYFEFSSVGYCFSFRNGGPEINPSNDCNCFIGCIYIFITLN